MITQEKLKIYEYYKGDSDGWSRTAKKKEHEIMNDKDWGLIDRLIQEIHLVNNSLASVDFADKINKNIKKNCVDEDVIILLKKLSKKCNADFY